jgi:hypothetical protein
VTSCLLHNAEVKNVELSLHSPDMFVAWCIKHRAFPLSSHLQPGMGAALLKSGDFTHKRKKA